jgi:hypothetical protein
VSRRRERAEEQHEVAPASRTALCSRSARWAGRSSGDNGLALRDLRRSAAPVGNLLARYMASVSGCDRFEHGTGSLGRCIMKYLCLGESRRDR